MAGRLRHALGFGLGIALVAPAFATQDVDRNETRDRRAPVQQDVLLEPDRGVGELADVPLEGGVITPAEPLDVVERRSPKVARTAEESASRAPPLAAEVFEGLLNDVRVCRWDVAVERDLPRRRVKAGTLELRWSTLPSGEVENAEVVAVTATDPDVLACAKRKMSTWRLAPSPNASHTEVRLSF